MRCLLGSSVTTRVDRDLKEYVASVSLMLAMSLRGYTSLGKWGHHPKLIATGVQYEVPLPIFV